MSNTQFSLSSQDTTFCGTFQLSIPPHLSALPFLWSCWLGYSSRLSLLSGRSSALKACMKQPSSTASVPMKLLLCVFEPWVCSCTKILIPAVFSLAIHSSVPPATLAILLGRYSMWLMLFHQQLAQDVWQRVGVSLNILLNKVCKVKEFFLC